MLITWCFQVIKTDHLLIGWSVDCTMSNIKTKHFIHDRLPSSVQHLTLNEFYRKKVYLKIKIIQLLTVMSFQSHSHVIFFLWWNRKRRMFEDYPGHSCQ